MICSHVHKMSLSPLRDGTGLPETLDDAPSLTVSTWTDRRLLEALATDNAWQRRCFLRWSLRMNLLRQISHSKRFSPSTVYNNDNCNIVIIPTCTILDACLMPEIVISKYQECIRSRMFRPRPKNFGSGGIRILECKIQLDLDPSPIHKTTKYPSPYRIQQQSNHFYVRQLNASHVFAIVWASVCLSHSWAVSKRCKLGSVSYTHLTLPTNREV